MSVTHPSPHQCEDGEDLGVGSGMEAGMAQVTASSRLDTPTKIPAIIRWWDGHTWTTVSAAFDATVGSTASGAAPPRPRPAPARVPELVPSPAAEPSQRGETGAGRRNIGQEPAPTRLVSTESETAGRASVRMDLRGLRSQVARLKDELDALHATVAPLGKEVTELQSGQREMASITSRIRGLLSRNSSIDESRTAPARYQKFHDS